MTDLADAFLALPGGIGTLDELFEAWSWNALGYHAKPFCLLNVEGFWDGMIEFIDHATQAASCPHSGAANCWSPTRLRKRWNCWTKPPQPLRRAWSGKRLGPGGGASCMNQKLLGVAGIVVILGIAFALSTNRKAIRLRVVGAAFALQAAIAFLVLYTSWGRAGIQTLSDGVANLLGYADQGHRIPVRAERDQPARPHLRDRRAAGDHLLREPGRHPLLSRHHAADRPLGRRRDRLGDRHQPRRIAVAPRRTSSSASRNRRWSSGPISPRCRRRGCSR